MVGKFWMRRGHTHVRREGIRGYKIAFAVLPNFSMNTKWILVFLYLSWAVLQLNTHGTERWVLAFSYCCRSNKVSGDLLGNPSMFPRVWGGPLSRQGHMKREGTFSDTTSLVMPICQNKEASWTRRVCITLPAFLYWCLAHGLKLQKYGLASHS